MSKLRHKLHEQEGATAVEYGIMVALIAVVIITAVGFLGGTLNEVFQKTCDDVVAGAEVGTCE